MLRRHMAVIGAVLILAASTVSPGRAAPADGVIEVVGQGGTSAELQLTQNTELLAFFNLFSARPWFERPARAVGETKGAFVGWYLQRLPDGLPIAGFVTIKALDGAFGRPTPIALVRHYPQVIPAGRYRVVLLADGPARALIRTVEPGPGRVIRTSAGQELTAPGPLTWNWPTASGSAPFQFKDRSTRFWEVDWSGSEPVVATHAAITCIAVKGEPGCVSGLPSRQPGSSGGAFYGTPGSSGAGAGYRSFTAEKLPPGAYSYELHGVGVSSRGGAFLIGLADAGDPFRPPA